LGAQEEQIKQKIAELGKTEGAIRDKWQAMLEEDNRLSNDKNMTHSTKMELAKYKEEIAAQAKKLEEQSVLLRQAEINLKLNQAEIKNIQDAREIQLINEAQVLAREKMLTEQEHQKKIKMIEQKEMAAEMERIEKVMQLEHAESLLQNSRIEAKKIQDSLVQEAEAFAKQKIMSEQEHLDKIKMLQDQELLAEQKREEKNMQMEHEIQVKQKSLDDRTRLALEAENMLQKKQNKLQLFEQELQRLQMPKNTSVDSSDDFLQKQSMEDEIKTLQSEIETLEKEIAMEEKSIANKHHAVTFIGNIHEVDDKTIELDQASFFEANPFTPHQKSTQQKKSKARSDCSVASSQPSRMSLRSSTRMKRIQAELPDDEESEEANIKSQHETSSVTTIDWVAKTLEFSPPATTGAGKTTSSSARRGKKKYKK
jgi:hypothetical protein